MTTEGFDLARLASLLLSALRTEPGLTARQLSEVLRDEARLSVDKTWVNSCLYSNRRLFRHDLGIPPAWYPVGPADFIPARESSPAQTYVGAWSPFLSLYPWQTRALDGWAAHGYRGIVEAVTGAGKTRLALAAIETEVRQGGRAVAIVPTKDLQVQWLEEIDEHLLDVTGLPARLGQLGGGGSDDLGSCDILVATVQSAAQHELVPPAYGGLLVADEVHHYGAEVWSYALETGFERRLGLTATYERDDGGVEAILNPYFGSYKYSLGYQEALSENVIARFKIAFIGVPFSGDELAAYIEQDDKARRRRGVLIREYGLAAEPFGLFMRQVQRLSRSGNEGARHAGMYLSAFSKRRQLLAQARGKFERLADLAPSVDAADSTIIFSQTRDAAEHAIEVLGAAGLSGETLHAALDPSERQETFDSFRDGTHRVIAAPRLLDEGVDVPEADLAIVLASSRSRRQMIQRMGRVIRKKADGRLARVAILYVEGTSEDPTEGAHEDFVQFVLDAADDVTVFDSGTDPYHVVAYLNAWH